MSKATKKRIRRIEKTSRFMILEDGLSDAERKYLDDLDNAMTAFMVQISEDFGPLSGEELVEVERMRASLPPGATSEPPSDAHLSARSKKKIKAVLENRVRNIDLAELEREFAPDDPAP